VSKEFPPLVLHPGHGKCGSSSIQAEIYRRREQLESRGVFIPDGRLRFGFEPDSPRARRPPEGADPGGAWYPVAYFRSLIEGRLVLSELERRLDEARARAAGERGVGRLLITSENLCRFQQGRTPELHRLIASRFERVRVLCYVRRQDDWILSAWQQWGHRNGLSLDEYVGRCLEQHHPRFLSAAENFERAYGPANVEVIPLHRSAFEGGELVPDFFRRAGIEWPADARGEEVRNEAINPHLCDILARVPALYPSDGDRSVRLLLERNASSPDLLFRRHRRFMSDATRNRILDYFARENEELHRRYFGHLDFDELFGRPEDRDGPRIDEEIEGIKEVLALQSDLLLQLLKRREGPARSPSLVRLLKDRLGGFLRGRRTYAP
jgi:hypothetical protein